MDRIVLYLPDGERGRIISEYTESDFKFYKLEIIEGKNKGAIIDAREDEIN